jgi:hypothetical protein
MDQQQIVRMIGFGKLYDGEHFLTDCRYELAEYITMLRYMAAEHNGVIESHSQIEGRIESTSDAPVEVPLVLHVNRKHRLRVLRQPNGRMVALGGFFEQ